MPIPRSGGIDGKCATPTISVRSQFARSTVRASSVLVVTSKFPDESLWAEVLNLGGYDVLAQPFDREEVTRVVRSAVRSSSDLWRSRLA